MHVPTTQEAAEEMLKSGEFHTSATLAQLLNTTAKKASGFLYNIRTMNKYETKTTDLPNRTVKVIAIAGRKKDLTHLWSLALGLRTCKTA